MSSYASTSTYYDKMEQDEVDEADIVPLRGNRHLCVRHRQVANQDVNQKLQKSLDSLTPAERSDITHIWSTFSSANHAKRTMILEGIMSMACSSQLSHISASLNRIIRFDPFSILPREVNLRILGYLDAISLGRAAQVSKSWKMLADDDLLWRRMCSQHIDRRCEKCGWGLPLLERRRLKVEVNEGSPAVAMGVGDHDHHAHDHGHGHGHEGLPVVSREEAMGRVKGDPLYKGDGVCDRGINELKRYASNEDGSRKRVKVQENRASPGPATRLTKPWKTVYCERLVVERNWRKARCTTTTLSGHTDGIMALQYHTSLAGPLHSILITGSYDKTVKVWDLSTGICLRTLTGHSRAVRSLQFDQRLLFTGSMDGTIRLWDWRKGTQLRILEGHTDGVLSLHYNGRLLASGSADNTIRIWNFTNGQQFVLEGHQEGVNSVLLWDGKTSPGDQDPTAIPSFSGSKRSHSPHRASSPVASLSDSAPAVEPGMMLFSASDDHTIRLWDLSTRRCIRTFTGHRAHVQSVKVVMVDMTEAEIKARKRLRSATPPVDPSASHFSFASASSAPLLGNAASISNMANVMVDVPEGFDPHAHRAARGKELQPRVYLHDAAGAVVTPSAELGEPDIWRTDVMGHAHHDHEVEEEKDQKRAILVSASLDGTVRMWDVESGVETNTLFGHIEGIWDCSVDKLRVASSSHDRCIKVWDRESGVCQQTLVGHKGAVTTCQLSDDLIVSGSDDGDVMVWSFAPDAAKAGTPGPNDLVIAAGSEGGSKGKGKEREGAAGTGLGSLRAPMLLRAD